MATRISSAIWEGPLKSGQGKVKLGSGGFEQKYSFSSRFENGEGTNPEELLAAAHAGCFSMALAGDLGQAGYPPKRITTTAQVTIERSGAGFKITGIELVTEADVPRLTASEFEEYAEKAKSGCPVSQALAATKITLTARLV